MKSFLLSVFLFCNACLVVQGQSSKPSGKYNILFIAIDDLKPNLNCYGFDETVTPQFDRLAQSATLFTQAYCQQAVCAPTRASLLTGLRPDKTKVWDLKTMIRDKNPDIVTLPQYFRMNGYHTIGMGKLFDQRSVDKEMDSLSWSAYIKKFQFAEGFEAPALGHYQDSLARILHRAGVKLGNASTPPIDAKKPTERMDVPDDAYADGAMANRAVEVLRKWKNDGKPFFLGVGFRKPHLPFVAPKKYWDLYDRNKISLASWQQPSKDGPEIAYHPSGELRSYAGIHSLDEKSELLKLPEDKQRELIHGYYACISYIDAQVGKLLDALKETGLDKNTIVVIWGDHGWHLGDHSLWNKHSNFEQATRVPMFIQVPGMTKGNKFAHPAEYVDIFPTLCALNGLAIPSQLDGVSLLPALKGNDVPVKAFAISQYPRSSGKGTRDVMGYSLRDNRYRLTEWVNEFISTEKPFHARDVVALELYDLVKDPLETVNLAKDPGMKGVMESLTSQLHLYYQQQYNTRISFKD
jgi:arylsulfatase A-like enzyme